ncbi:MAG: adenosine-specific kinase [Candidatus Muirbacterium halophilum]|nr:adenosine-specific kinase [Candidatus Muirbacterium halophilum]MCK9476635.1 adenosine-specific kinase [Candidatus Muirbacterium halophilum]
MLKSIKIINPNEYNFILGQSHFIKTVEDIHELIVNTNPNAEFGIAFSEASGPCLIRKSGNNKELIELACENINNIYSGHSFIIFMKNAFPINFLPGLKNIPEIAGIYCATANPVEVIVYNGENGCGIMGIVDGFSPKGIEKDEDIIKRKEFLRNIGYKF